MSLKEEIEGLSTFSDEIGVTFLPGFSKCWQLPTWLHTGVPQSLPSDPLFLLRESPCVRQDETNEEEK